MNGVDRAQLTDYLVRQRWFTGRASNSVTAVRALDWLRPPDDEMGVRIELVTVSDGTHDQIYNVPLVYRRTPGPQLEHALVGVAPMPEGEWLVYDALHDPEAVRVLIAAFRLGDVTTGEVSYAVAREPGITDESTTVMLSAEQSNTSIIIDDRMMLKCFRRVAPGRNPDIEVLGALSADYGDSVATLLGWMSSVPLDDLAPCDLAILQNFWRTATDGWESARISVRDFLAEPDLVPDEAGGDFAGEAERLGAATARVHAGMAQLLTTGTWGPPDLARLAGRLRARLASAIELVPQLAPHQERVEAAYDRIAALREPVPVQRVHGDLHLGQTLRTSAGWKIIDFEGEPAKPLSERIGLDSPWRDVAGMLRSFDYVASSVLFQVEVPDGEARAHEWVLHNRAAYLRGYGQVAHGESEQLLQAYEFDKAVYEVAYEAQHRPTWLDVPLRAFTR